MGDKARGMGNEELTRLIQLVELCLDFYEKQEFGQTLREIGENDIDYD